MARFSFRGAMTLEPLLPQFSVCRLEQGATIPEWATKGSVFSVTKTHDELSIVCETARVPKDVKQEGPWRALKVCGPLDFALTGILSSLANPLAAAKISLFALSTFDTDYILIPEDKFERAIETLTEAGHLVSDPLSILNGFTQPQLETPRLILEPIDETHTEEIWELFNDNELHRFYPYEPVPIEQQRERCTRWASRRHPDGSELWLNWIGHERATGKAIAHIQVAVKANLSASIAYVFARSHQRRGLAYEAVQRVFDYVREQLNAYEVKAWTDTRNIASQRLAEKLGMKQTELIKDADFFNGHSSDEYVYTKTFRK